MPGSLIKASTSTSVSSNTKVAQALMKSLQAENNAYVTVGIHNDTGSYEDLTADGATPVPVAKVANWIEYGTKFMPARPFLYSTMRNKERTIAGLMSRAQAAYTAGKMSLVQALGSVGAQCVAFIQNAISSNPGEPLSPKYLARRMVLFPEAGSRTLIRTGLLLRSVNFKVWVGGQNVSDSGTGQDNGAHAGGPAGRAAGRRDMKADRNARAAQKAAAKANPAAAKARFDAQRRVRPERKPKDKG